LYVHSLTQKTSEEQSTRCDQEPCPTIKHPRHAANTPFSRYPSLQPLCYSCFATTKQRQEAAQCKHHYANSILRGSSMYSFTLTVRSHDNNHYISRLFARQLQDN
jgi:hypothetical protein